MAFRVAPSDWSPTTSVLTDNTSARGTSPSSRYPSGAEEPGCLRATVVWMNRQHPAIACSEDEFAELVESELDALPRLDQVRDRTHNVGISIEDERHNEPRTLGVFARYSGTSRPQSGELDGDRVLWACLLRSQSRVLSQSDAVP